MSPYLNNPQALRALVRPREVHRALYLVDHSEIGIAA
jgi:hypothetical protein